MVRVGNYEILAELCLTEHGSVSKARRVADMGDAGRLFAVKKFALAVEDPAEPRWELQSFLDRARVQQSMAADGASNWAPIHDLWLDGDIAYYAVDYLPLNLQKLMDGRVAIGEAGLFQLVLGIVDGLDEIEKFKGRCHGNLKPGNVLIDGSDLASARVLLADPATKGQAAKVGQAGDLQMLGEIIYRLALHEAPAPGQSRIPESPAWNALGPHGDRWRQFCAALLDPQPDLYSGRRPNIADLREVLQDLRPRKKFPIGRAAAVLLVPVLLLALAVVGLSLADHAARSQFAAAKSQWFGKLLDAASDPARARRWRADPDLNRILNQIPAADLRAIDCDTDRLVRWNFRDFLDVKDGNRVVQAVQDELPLRLHMASRAADLRSRFQLRGWDQPAAYLSKLLADVTPAPGNDVAAGIDRLLIASPHIESGLKLADSDWAALLDRLRSIRSPHDPVLTALANALQKAADSDVHLDDRGFSGLVDLQQDSALAQKLADTIQNTWPTYVDRESLDKDIAKSIDVKHARKEDARKWLELVAANALRRDETIVAAADLRKRLAETTELIQRTQMKPGETSAYLAANRAAAIAISDFEQVPFTRRMVDDGTFARKRDEVRNFIEGLRRFYHPLDPEQFLNHLASVATGSRRINEFWDAWRRVLRDGLPEMAASNDVFSEREQASEQLRSLLVALDQGFPPAPPFPNESYSAAAQARREAAIARLLPLIDLHNPRLDPVAMKSAQDDFGAWSTELIELSQDFPIKKEILTADDHPDRQWKKKDPAFWNDPEVIKLVKDDVARLDRLAALDHASREELVTVLNTANEAELALKAWQLLGGKTIVPPWPTQTDELQAELKFRQRLSGSFNALKDPAEADGPSRELAAQAPIRWRRFVENATSQALLLDAWKLRSFFAPEAKELSALPAAARYDLFLACLHQALDAGDEDGVQSALTGLSQAIPDMKDHLEIANLPDRIAGIDAHETFADKNPGDTFGLTLPGLAAPMMFKRVEPASARPFYLCTTSISAGQFASILDGASAWTTAREFPWPYQPGKPDVRRGPRTWEWTATGMTTPLLWLAPDEANDFPPALRAGRFNRMVLSDGAGGTPSPDHPMQYVSAQTALYFASVCGCRLPSSAEWQAAYSGFEKNVPPDKWNLRDQTWDAQRLYVASGNGSRWPDEDIFPAGDSTANSGRNASCRPTKDGALYFQAVNASNAAVFRHLIGNVAEFVCDAPERFDRWSEKKTPEGIRKFIEASPNALFVIGGSALSPPDAPLDRPLAVAHADEAYADVGIRLAFTAPSRSIAERVKWAIGDPPFIWPQKSTTRQSP